MERRAESREKAQKINIEHRTPNAEHRTSNVGRGRGVGSRVKGSASRGRWSSLFANGEGEALGKDGFCWHEQAEKESGEEATEMG